MTDDDWMQILDTAGELLRSGDWSSGREVLLNAVADAEIAWGADASQLIDPLRMLAKSYSVELGPLNPDNKLEIHYLERALAIARSQLGARDLEVANLLGLLGSRYRVSGRVEDGCKLELQGFEIARHNGKEASFAHLLLRVGMARMADGRPAHAVQVLEQAADLEKRGDPSSLGHALTRFHLGKCLLLLDSPTGALNELESALRVADGLRVRGQHARLVSEIMETIDEARSAIATH